MDNERAYIEKIRKKFQVSVIENCISKFKGLNVLIIGDIIIDQYAFVLPKGRAIKDPILSTRFFSEETYAGGVLAIANHISSFVDKITLVGLVGDKDQRLDFIKGSLAKNISTRFFVKENSPTILKKRYIDQYRNNKLFKTEYMDDRPISGKLTEEIVKLLQMEISKFDIVITSDFGHGFINNEIRKVLEEKSRYMSLNVQSNSSNMGYNYINHYQCPGFISLNEEEIRLPLMMRFDPIEDVIVSFNNKFRYNKFLVTLGKRGSLYHNNHKNSIAPTLVTHVVDTVGAGDAVFAISSLFAFINAEDDMIPFIANCAGGVKSSYMGNKEPISKEKLLNFIEELYKRIE